MKKRYASNNIYLKIHAYIFRDTFPHLFQCPLLYSWDMWNQINHSVLHAKRFNHIIHMKEIPREKKATNEAYDTAVLRRCKSPCRAPMSNEHSHSTCSCTSDTHSDWIPKCLPSACCLLSSRSTESLVWRHKATHTHTDTLMVTLAHLHPPTQTALW